MSVGYEVATIGRPATAPVETARTPGEEKLVYRQSQCGRLRTSPWLALRHKLKIRRLLRRARNIVRRSRPIGRRRVCSRTSVRSLAAVGRIRGCWIGVAGGQPRFDGTQCVCLERRGVGVLAGCGEEVEEGACLVVEVVAIAQRSRQGGAVAAPGREVGQYRRGDLDRVAA